MTDGEAPTLELPGFKGLVLRAEDDAYDDARRVFNGTPGGHSSPVVARS
jgi:hypothetical protein